MTKAPINHYPLPTKRRLPSHAGDGDTAHPHAAINCLECRAMLQKKVDAHSREAHSARSEQNRRFFAADAAYWRSVLATGQPA